MTSVGDQVMLDSGLPGPPLGGVASGHVVVRRGVPVGPETAAANVIWLDIDASGVGAANETERRRALETLLAELRSDCGDRIDEAMVRDLLEVTDQREGERYSDGAIRSLSAFRVATERITTGDDEVRHGVGGRLVIEPVEFLASREWVITCWHAPRVFDGNGLAIRDTESRSHVDVVEAVTARWACAGDGTAGDLAVLVLHELTLSYAPAYRAVRGWLEEWELQLYRDGNGDARRLRELWGSMAQLREWINPLNRPGLRAAVEKAWFCGVRDHKLVIQVDDRVDRALRNLRNIADTLRASFGVLHAQELEKEREAREQDRDARERFQRSLEVMAAIFLVPTLIVGFFGVNTRLPGQQTWWGFWAMVGIIIALTTSTVAVVRRRGSRVSRSPRDGR
jgi:Mg2+ and Co2+ transporter CorA